MNSPCPLVLLHLAFSISPWSKVSSASAGGKRPKDPRKWRGRKSGTLPDMERTSLLVGAASLPNWVGIGTVALWLGCRTVFGPFPRVLVMLSEGRSSESFNFLIIRASRLQSRPLPREFHIGYFFAWVVPPDCCIGCECLPKLNNSGPIKNALAMKYKPMPRKADSKILPSPCRDAAL